MVRKIPYHAFMIISGVATCDSAEESSMQTIHEETTLTSKGQITVPKSVRQALGVDVGEKIAFDLYDGEIVVSRAIHDAEHADPAIQGFLSLLEKDIQAGKNITTLPDHLVVAMRSALASSSSADDDISGEVAL